MPTLDLPATLSSVGKTLDLAPDKFGLMTDSAPLLAAGAIAALRERMAADGHLLLRGFHDRAPVQAARASLLKRLAAQGRLNPDQPLEDAVPARSGASFSPEITQRNEEVRDVVYGPGMMGFFDKFLGAPSRHYDFTWMRTVSPGQATVPHMDIVYMGRGTRQLYTVWTPYGDTPMTMGSLMVLENSHHNQRLIAGYGSKDVDTFCENRRAPGYTKMGGGGNIADGGFLSRDPVTLRKRLGGRWLASDFQMGDILIFSVFLVHCSLDNTSERMRLTTDTRYQLASEPADERWVGDDPIGHGPEAKRGMIC